jgi:hypothetical protein
LADLNIVERSGHGVAAPWSMADSPMMAGDAAKSSAALRKGS